LPKTLPARSIIRRSGGVLPEISSSRDIIRDTAQSDDRNDRTPNAFESAPLPA